MQKDALEPAALMSYTTFELALPVLALEGQPPQTGQCSSQKQLGQGQSQKDPLPSALGKEVGSAR